jgi:hypothetical protein
MAKNEYKVLQGISYPPNKRAEIGTIVSDLPKESVAWLLSSGIIEAVSEAKKPIVTKVESPVIEEIISDDVTDELVEEE